MSLGGKLSSSNNQHQRLDDDQWSVLQENYTNDSYPTEEKIRILSDTLGLSIVNVDKWLKNARRKLRSKGMLS